jgi:hypothetical protein
MYTIVTHVNLLYPEQRLEGMLWSAEEKREQINFQVSFNRQDDPFPFVLN